MPTWRRLLAVATAAAVLASVAATAQAKIKSDSTVTGAEIYLPGDPFKCGMDEGFGRRNSCEQRVL